MNVWESPYLIFGIVFVVFVIIYFATSSQTSVQTPCATCTPPVA